MPELQKRDGGSMEQSGAYRFAKAWELAVSRREGRQEGRKEGLDMGRKYGKLQALESLLGLPETPIEALAALSPKEIDQRIARFTRQVRARIS